MAVSPQIRQAIHDSPESIRVLAKRYGLNPKTVAQWKSRVVLEDKPRGPKSGSCRALLPEEEQIIVAFRTRTRLPLDDCLYVLLPILPHLTRATLHRCLKRHGLSRLDLVRPSPGSRHLSGEAMGRFDLMLTQCPTQEICLYLYGATDLHTRWSYFELYEQPSSDDAVRFLMGLFEQTPYFIHTLQTDDQACFRQDGLFGEACKQLGIQHVLDQGASHSITFPSVPSFHKYKNRADLEQHLAQFVEASTHKRRLKTLGGLTPHDALCRLWEREPQWFKFDPRESR